MTVTYTTEEIAIEGFRRAGRCLTDRDIKRAMNVVYEVRHDIWNRTTQSGTTQLRSLAVDAVMLTKPGMSRYRLPDDFNEIETLHLMQGQRTISTMAISLPKSVICAASQPLTVGDAGKRIVWQTGVAEAYLQEIATIFKTANWVLEMEAAFEDSQRPSTGATFMVVDTIEELDKVWADEVEGYSATQGRGRPTEYFTQAERLQFDRPCDKEYALRMRYYAHIAKIPVGSKLDQQINFNWYSVLIKGVYWIAAQEIGDTVARDAFQQYLESVEHLKWREQDRGADESRFTLNEWH